MMQPVMMLLLLPMFASADRPARAELDGRRSCASLVSDGDAVPDADSAGDDAAAADVAGRCCRWCSRSGTTALLRLGRRPDLPRRPADAGQAAEPAGAAEVDSSVDAMPTSSSPAPGRPAPSPRARWRRPAFETLLVDAPRFRATSRAAAASARARCGGFRGSTRALAGIDVHRIVEAAPRRAARRDGRHRDGRSERAAPAARRVRSRARARGRAGRARRSSSDSRSRRSRRTTRRRDAAVARRPHAARAGRRRRRRRAQRHRRSGSA